jgi:hypothetical protein
MKRALFGVVCVVLCGLVAEVTLQGVYRLRVGAWLRERTALPLYEPDPVCGFRLKPDLELRHATSEFRTMIHTNGHGFRTSAAHEEPPRAKPPGVRRILLLGPSFAFGWGVDHEETFLERLRERLLREGALSADSLQVLNAGVPALGPVQQLAWFRATGRTWSPDLVIQFVYGSPVVSAAYSEGFTVDEAGYLVPAGLTGTERLRRRLKGSALVYHGWLLSTRFRRATDDPRGPGPIAGAGRTLEAVSGFSPDDESVQDALAFYAELRDAVREAGGRLLVIYFPLSYCIHPEDAARWRHLGVEDPAARIAFDRGVTEHLVASGVPCLNLTPELQAAVRAGGERLYHAIDIHWTPAGHRVAADAAARHLLPRLAAYGLADDPGNES